MVVLHRLWNVALIIWSILLLGSTGLALAQRPQALSGWVQMKNGKRLPRVEVRVVNVGGTTTSDSGEFALSLPPGFGPGDPLVLHVREPGKEWFITSPFDGRTFVPKRDPIQVIVARKGDLALLEDQEVIGRLVEAFSTRLESKIAPIAAGIPGEKARLEPLLASAPQPEEFLAEKAKELGFTVEQLKSAITDWSKRVQEPYQKGLAALYEGRPADASKYIGESITSSEGELVEKYVTLARAEDRQGHFPAAESALRKARALRPSDPLILSKLGLLLTIEAKFAEAEPLYKRALAIREKALGPEHPDVATSLYNLAVLYDLQYRRAEAEPLYKRALAIREKALGPEHLDVFTTLDNLAGLYYAQGRDAEAEAFFKRALAIWEKALDPERWYVAAGLNNLLTGLYYAKGRYAEAEPLYRRLLIVTEKRLGPDHEQVAGIAESLARTLYALGQNTEAKRLRDRAASIRAAKGKVHEPQETKTPKQ